MKKVLFLKVCKSYHQSFNYMFTFIKRFCFLVFVSGFSVCMAKDVQHGTDFISQFVADHYHCVSFAAKKVFVTLDGYMPETKEMNDYVYRVFYLKGYALPEMGYVSKPFYYRQEEMRVYRYSETLGREILVYDFGMDVGDEFTTEDGVRLRVTRVADSSMLDNSLPSIIYGRTLWLTGVYDDSIQDIWVEEIGSVFQGLLSDLMLKEVGFPSLEHRYFLFREVNSDGVDAYPFSIDTAYLKANVFSVQEETVVEKDPAVSITFVGNSLNIKGVMNFSCEGVQYVGCAIDGDTITFMDFQYPPQMDCVNPYAVDLTFPNFEKGKYWITLDGENYVEVVCGETSTITHTLATSVCQLTNIYDFSGYRIVSPPTKGFYIQNGKKYWVK